MIASEIYQDTIEKLNSIESEVKNLNKKDFDHYFDSIISNILTTLILAIFSSVFLILKNKKPSSKDQDSQSNLRHRSSVFLDLTSGGTEFYELIHRVPIEFKTLIAEALTVLNRQKINTRFQLVISTESYLKLIKDEILNLLNMLKILLSFTPQKTSECIKNREFNSIINKLQFIIDGVKKNERKERNLLINFKGRRL